VGSTHRFAEWWVISFGRLDRSLDVSPIDLLVGGECDRKSSASRLAVRVPFIHGCLPDPVKVQVIDPNYGCDPTPHRPMYDSRFVPVDCRLRELHSNLRAGMEPVPSLLREPRLRRRSCSSGLTQPQRSIGLHVDVAGVEVFGGSPNHNRFSAEYLPQGSRHQQVPFEGPAQRRLELVTLWLSKRSRVNPSAPLPVGYLTDWPSDGIHDCGEFASDPPTTQWDCSHHRNP
jgi:hypothetical protein